jgi:hypothetical protein
MIIICVAVYKNQVFDIMLSKKSSALLFHLFFVHMNTQREAWIFLYFKNIYIPLWRLNVKIKLKKLHFEKL